MLHAQTSWKFGILTAEENHMFLIFVPRMTIKVQSDDHKYDTVSLHFLGQSQQTFTK